LKTYFLIKLYKHFIYLDIWGKLVVRDELSFEDGIMLAKYIYQSVIDKTLNGVIEQEEIFYKTHDILEKIQNNTDVERLDEILYYFNMENVYKNL